ncbi:MAG: hypothetical protein IJU27_06610 [Bacteroidales bacterium]|nr:hypothetical protein [Bacteroidales bacterium]
MKTNHLLILLICLFSFHGCRTAVSEEWPAEYDFSAGEEQKEPLRAELVESSRLFPRASRFFVYADSVLVVVNKPQEGSYLVELADLGTGKVLASTLMYGNGPLEALLPIPHMDSDALYLRDVVRRRVLLVDVAALLNAPSSYFPTVLDDYSDIRSTFATKLNENTMLYENAYCFADKHSGFVNNGQERIIFTSPGHHGNVKTGNPRYDTYNVSQGFIVPFDSSDRIFYVSSGEPLIEIYDSSGKKLKRLSGPGKLSVEYGLSGEQVLFKGKIPYAFVYACSYDERVYMNYIGDYFDNNYSALKSTILEMDLDGVLLKAYCSPVFISSFSIASDGIIYGQGYDVDNNVVLWKLSHYIK